MVYTVTGVLKSYG